MFPHPDYLPQPVLPKGWDCMYGLRFPLAIQFHGESMTFWDYEKYHAFIAALFMPEKTKFFNT